MAVFVNKVLLKHNHAHSFGYRLWLLLCWGWVVATDCLTKKPRIFLSGSLEKRFTSSCSRWDRLGVWADVSLTHKQNCSEIWKMSVFFPLLAFSRELECPQQVSSLAFRVSWVILLLEGTWEEQRYEWSGMCFRKWIREMGGCWRFWVPLPLCYCVSCSLGCLCVGGVWCLMLTQLSHWHPPPPAPSHLRKVSAEVFELWIAC